MNGVKIYDDIADCGHQHKSINNAEQCLSKLGAKRSTTWINAEIRDGDGHPVISDEKIAELYLRDLELAIEDRSYAGSDLAETAYHVCCIWLVHNQPESSDMLYKRVQLAAPKYAKLR